MQIRRVTNSTQLQKIAAMDAICFPNDDPISDWHESDWYLVYEGGDILGYGSKKELAGDITYLNRVGVLPAHRGKGIQRKLLDRRIKDSQGSTIITYTVNSNPASSNNLIRKGFLLFIPENQWVEGEVLYWIKKK